MSEYILYWADLLDFRRASRELVAPTDCELAVITRYFVEHDNLQTRWNRLG